MAPDRRGVDHMLSVTGEPQLDQSFQECIPHSLFGPTPEANVNGIPFAVTFVHVALWAAEAHDVKHAVQKTPIVLAGLAQRPRSGGNSGEIIAHSSLRNIPTGISCSPCFPLSIPQLGTALSVISPSPSARALRAVFFAPLGASSREV